MVEELRYNGILKSHIFEDGKLSRIIKYKEPSIPSSTQLWVGFPERIHHIPMVEELRYNNIFYFLVFEILGQN